MPDDAFPGFRVAAAGASIRRLALILGDQLDRRLPRRLGLDPATDAVVMVEAAEEASHVPSHRARTALFLSAMRHFAVDLAAREPELPLHYIPLDEPGHAGSIAGELDRWTAAASIEALVVIRPGEHRLLAALRALAAARGWSLELVENPHFLTTPDEFDRWAEGRKELTLEYFYRALRKRFEILIEDGGPTGGRWNYDRDNRKSPGADSPRPPEPPSFTPDAITREVLERVAACFPDAPGSLESFAWPVTREQALEALEHFLDHRLQHFGTYQDAMLRDRPWMWHSLLSAPLNLGLLDPREVVDGALARFAADRAPLNAVEGFVRQIVGWREFIRGVYYREGAAYGTLNALEATEDLPPIYWSGETEMECMRQSLGQVLEHGYGHHIQRLMVTGLFALLAGVRPRQVADWYLGMYVDGVDWVTLPNTLGMALYGDGGIVGSKPYAASGKYIQRMSNYCAACPFDPAQRTGDRACPFTTLYWDFLLRHRERLAGNRRMGFALRNVERLEAEERTAIQRRAEELRRRLRTGRALADTAA